MVARAAKTRPLTPPNPRIQWTDNQKQQGTLSSTALSIMQQHHNAIDGLTPTVPCTCTNVGNVYTLTPFNVSPQVKGYFSYTSFAFVASGTSAGLITATVVPTTGSLSTLKVYKTHGSAQATLNDLTINLFYVVYYVDTLDAGSGGFVLI